MLACENNYAAACNTACIILQHTVFSFLSEAALALSLSLSGVGARMLEDCVGARTSQNCSLAPRKEKKKMSKR